jgi:hypothetical protein
MEVAGRVVALGLRSGAEPPPPPPPQAARKNAAKRDNTMNPVVRRIAIRSSFVVDDHRYKNKRPAI